MHGNRFQNFLIKSIAFKDVGKIFKLNAMLLKIKSIAFKLKVFAKIKDIAFKVKRLGKIKTLYKTINVIMKTRMDLKSDLR